MRHIRRYGLFGFPLNIPAGDAHYTIADSYVLPVDVEVLAVQPHAHYRARDVRGMATLPDGTERGLITVSHEKYKEEIESPTAIHYRGITITPGGFIEAAGIYRTHNENPTSPVIY